MLSYCVIEEVAGLTGKTLDMQNMMETEISKKKREWLASFSRPEVLGADVGALGEDEVLDHISGKVKSIPTSGCFVYTFGYSCKDLSTLNNHSGKYKGNCLKTGQGSTGATWQGNLQWVRRSQPPILLIENVRAALKGQNLAQMKTDLSDAGYEISYDLLNALQFYMPQDRLRAWICAMRRDLCGDVASWPQRFLDVLQTMKCSPADIIPLKRFLLQCDSEYLVNLHAAKHARMKRLRASKATLNKKGKVAKGKKGKKGKGAKESTDVKAKPVKSRSNIKWKLDHWRIRRLLNLTPPAVVARGNSEVADLEHDGVKAILCDRESDLFHSLNAGASRSTTSTQMKHSTERVVMHAGAKHRHGVDCTSCILPSSKIVLWPPLVANCRMLSGLEALAIQGIPQSFHSTHGTSANMRDCDYMSLAGNAFNGSCAGAMMIAALATMDTSNLQWGPPEEIHNAD